MASASQMGPAVLPTIRPKCVNERHGLKSIVEIWAVARLQDTGRQIVTDLIAVRDSADSAQAEFPRGSEYYS